MRFLSMEMADNGDLAVQVMEETDQSEAVQEVRTIYVNLEQLGKWEHAAYYYREMMQDIDEFLGWVDKYRRGVA